MIKLENIDVTFKQGVKVVNAVKNVSLHVEPGDIYGIIGYSGAGKSTLVRTINLLQRPTKGNVVVNGVDLLKLKPKGLRAARKKIGMIFQHFNLMNTLSVFDNVAFPLKKSGKTKSEIEEKVREFLIEDLEIEEEKIVPEGKLKDDLGIDSLDFVDIVVIVEKKFGFKIKPEEMAGITTLKQFCDYIESKVNNA